MVVVTADVPASPLTEAAEIEVIESNGERLTAAWYTIDDLAHGRRVVYPDGVLSLVRQVLSRNAPHSR